MKGELLEALGPEFLDPPREFSLCPFWFWNDDLTEAEILSQIGDFQDHGVHAFVIHPRVGLPRQLGWMSSALLGFMKLAVEEAERRGMWVVLYDEGMYPSGSSAGQVVAQNPAFQCRGLEKRPIGTPIGSGETLLGMGEAWQVIERPIDSVIRGLHYVGEGSEEETPLAADLLNPQAVKCFVDTVYGGYQLAFGEHFGKTIKGIFTDEPSLLGRPRETGLIPGTTDILSHVQRLTGVDLSDNLDRLWIADSEERKAYDRALRLRLHETYYTQLQSWCREAGVDLMGHPEHADDLASLEFFDVPGQDLVWRWVLPGPTAIEGPQSVQAKVASSAMRHSGKRRNSNELAGAYGHELTFEEFKWLFDWCLVRGTNLFFPHAFYYSIRGPRRDERPPDVGPNSPWWEVYPTLATYVARLSWLNTDSEHICDLGLVVDSSRVPWNLAKKCLQHQVSFEYLGSDELKRNGSRYRVEVCGQTSTIEDVLRQVPRSLNVEVHPDLRVRRIRKNGVEMVMAHNEGESNLRLRFDQPHQKLDPWNLTVLPQTEELTLAPFEFALLWEKS